MPSVELITHTEGNYVKNVVSHGIMKNFKSELGKILEIAPIPDKEFKLMSEQITKLALKYAEEIIGVEKENGHDIYMKFFDAKDEEIARKTYQELLRKEQRQRKKKLLG